MNDEERLESWKSLISLWEGRGYSGMAPALFCDILSHREVAREAIRLAGENSGSWALLRLQLMLMQVLDRSEPYVRKIRDTVLSEREIEGLFVTSRERLSPGDRPGALSELVRGFVHAKGREAARMIALGKWWHLPLIEEEREGLVMGLLSGGIREWSYFRLLGPLALRVVARSGYSIEADGSAAVVTTPTTPADLRYTASRIDALLAPASLTVDHRDAGLTQAELGMLSSATPAWSALAMALKRARHRGPELAELAHLLSHEAPVALPTQPRPDGLAAWQFPVLRLIHLQQVLEAPQMSRTVRDPTLVLVPDAALYLLGRDDVFYQPELRVLRGADRRWRARWIESAGEAASIMFLEDTLQLELASVARVPEQSNRETPDFMAQTTSRERLVFESKGATDWSTHKKQRRKALRQLGKDTSAAGAGWAGGGRTFACSLFAASQGEDRSSLLHVDDPPFGFEGFFPEGWEYRCRREHAVAMLQAARIFQAADELSRRGQFSTEQAVVQTFVLGDGDETDGGQFMGNYLPLADWARELRHPNQKICQRLRVFLGIERGQFNNFAHGQFPSRSDRIGIGPETESVIRRPARPSVGALPGGEGGMVPRGIFSLLADGSFMAIELDQ